MDDQLSQLRERLADVERFLLIEEAADRGADLQKIARLRQHRIALHLEIDALVASKIAGAA